VTRGTNPYPNGILFIPTELEELQAFDREGLYAPEEQIRSQVDGGTFPAVVRIPAALVPRGTLAEGVLSGEACIRCGGKREPMIPCGTGPEGAIFVHDPLCEPPSWPVVDQLEFYREHYFEYLDLWGETGREVIRLASEGRWFDLLEMIGDGLNAKDAASDESVAAYDIAGRKARVAEAVEELRAAGRELADRLPDDGLDEDLRRLKAALDSADEAEAGEPGEIDLGTCAYLARSLKLPGYDPEATCSFGCVDEPACVTSEPDGGWPSRRADGEPSRYRVVFEVSVPKTIPAEEHVSLAVGVTAAPDFLPDRVYRRVGTKWEEVPVE